MTSSPLEEYFQSTCASWCPPIVLSSHLEYVRQASNFGEGGLRYAGVLTIDVGAQERPLVVLVGLSDAESLGVYERLV